jgi:hypothetical protein
MNTVSTRSAQASFGAAFKQALLPALDGTGLESRFVDGTEPGTDECLPWLQQSGGDDRDGYWIACGLCMDPAVLPTPWPSFVSVSWVREDEAADITRGCDLLDLKLAGRGSRDPHVLAAIAVATVLRHIAQGCPDQLNRDGCVNEEENRNGAEHQSRVR